MSECMGAYDYRAEWKILFLLQRPQPDVQPEDDRCGSGQLARRPLHRPAQGYDLE